MNILLCFSPSAASAMQDKRSAPSTLTQIPACRELPWANTRKSLKMGTDSSYNLGYKLSLRAITQTAQRCCSENPKSTNSLTSLTSSRVLWSSYSQITTFIFSSTFQRIKKIKLFSSFINVATSQKI